MATNQIFPVTPPNSFSNLLSSQLPCALPGVLSSLNSDNITQAVDMHTQVILMPFCLDTNWTGSFLATYVVTGLAASTVTMGIYGITYAYPDLPSGAPLVVGDVATTVQGIVDFAISLKLNQNTLYWAAIQASSSVTQAFQVIQTNLCSSGPTLITAGIGLTPALYTYVNSYSAGTLPTINPASLTTVSGLFTPVIYLA